MTTEYAFPHENNHTYKMTGMKLRDYFAAKAMQAIAVESLKQNFGDLKLLTKNAYHIADAMMEARK
jgi:hypothetical protein